MGDLLGWINIVLILLMSTIYPIKKSLEKNKGEKTRKLYRVVRKAHPILGIIIIVIGFTHGYLQLGTLRLHSGLYILITILIMASIAVIGPRIKRLKKEWRKIHRYMVIPLAIFVINHIIKMF